MRESLVSFVGILLSVAVAGVSGALGGVLYVRHQTPPPRIVILDMRRLIEPVVNDASLADSTRRQRIAEIGSAVRKSVERYAQGGAIVLDGSSILRAPREAYVEP
jgi:hypothetical protein